MRQIVLDTETTGIDPKQGHRIIEIGCVEVVGRKLTGRHFHKYINPEREVEQEAINVHGITNEFLADKPVFAQVAEEFMAFIEGAQLVIHNAAFDVGHIDNELGKWGNPRWKNTAAHCSVLDTLQMAREKHPGQKNNLDALCKRYHVDNSARDLHGALLDAEILADVYLLMTGGQTDLALGQDGQNSNKGSDSGLTTGIRRIASGRQPGRIIVASEAEVAGHNALMESVEKAAGHSLWPKG
ncbi:DNA polymerase III subunit epsilon [Biformimicrobium ophioploci]|uniref:DNA polymerase III subunit epsilon n=1 Tax=Biformimicrobium ophioploci TaxID=3036711 RepID=A0ABQ6M2W4_9GAMM|nr:DNA polymerase III subunit epsilon [Microbulbifer sp. NKW57]GMG88691.1 DNA polymerase III subunit epsilon [Microbulbifer sp. NKW57]